MGSFSRHLPRLDIFLVSEVRSRDLLQELNRVGGGKPIEDAITHTVSLQLHDPVFGKIE